MIISYRNEFIFIHNYKVAGTSISKALQKYGIINGFEDPKKEKLINKIIPVVIENYILKITRRLKIVQNNPDLFFKSHIRAKELRKKLPSEIYDNFYKFGFVRNPWAWQVSLYHYMKQNKNHYQHDIIKNMNFDDYILWRVNDNYSLQKSFFYDNNKRIVDYIGKLENINKDFNYICEKIGINTKLPHKNKSTHKKYRKYYTDETRQIIEEYFAEDIKEFNYQF